MCARYSLIGCSSCDALKVVDGNPKTTQCSNCEARLKFRKLAKFYESDDSNDVAQAKAIVLARREGKEDEITELVQAGVLDGDIPPAISDEEMLKARGVNPEDVVEAAEQKTTPRKSYEDIIIEAIEAVDTPTKSEIAGYAEEYYAKETEKTESIVEELYLRGDLIRSQEGVYTAV